MVSTTILSNGQNRQGEVRTLNVASQSLVDASLALGSAVKESKRPPEPSNPADAGSKKGSVLKSLAGVAGMALASSSKGAAESRRAERACSRLILR